MSLISTCILAVDGLFYVGMGTEMLAPYTLHVTKLATIYTSLVKNWREPADPSVIRSAQDLSMDLGYRVVAYLLIMLGAIRILTAFHWGCGFIHLGLATCLSEIAMIVHELLQYESLLLHRAITFMLINVILSIVYIANALPYCV